MLVKRKQMKDFEFYDFCNNVLSTIRNHWLFAENGISFEETFNIINIAKHLGCEIELGGNTHLNTHDGTNFDKN